MGQGIGLGCALGTAGGVINVKKPLQGAAAGGALGCLFGTRIAPGIPLPPTPIGAGIGALLGGISGGLTAAAAGGTPLQIAVGALGGAAGGAISNLLPFGPVIGAVAGAGATAFLSAIGPTVPAITIEP